MDANIRQPEFFECIGEWGYTLVFCDACGAYYDVREVSELPTRVYKLGLQKILFDCPRGHHAKSFKVWNSSAAIAAGRAFDEEFLKACGIEVEQFTGFRCGSCDRSKDDGYMLRDGIILCEDCAELWERDPVKTELNGDSDKQKGNQP